MGASSTEARKGPAPMRTHGGPAFLTVIVVLLLGALAASAETPQVVASVIAIKGRMTCERPGRGTYAAFVQMPDFVRDRLSTDATSIGAIEFAVGGKIGMNKSTTVEITGARSAADGSGQVLAVNSGAVWARFEKQGSQLIIRTPSATLGIRGTEFLVDAGPDATRVDVFEGAVAYAPAGADTVPQNAPLARAGMRLVIGKALEAKVETYDVDKMRKEDALRFPDLAEASHALRIASGVLAHLPNGAANSAKLQNAAWTLDHTQAVVNEPLQAAQQAIDRMDSQLGRIGISIPGLPTTASQQASLDFPVDLLPYQAEAGPPRLTFSWKPFPGAARYVVLVSSDPEMAQSNLQWATQVDGPSALYPPDGPPLDAGQKYFWRVVAMDEQGRPIGKASQTWFRVPASGR